MDMAFVNALNASRARSRRTTRGWRRGPQLLLPRPPGDGDRARCGSPASRRTWATTSRSRRSSRSPRSAVFTLAGTLWAAARARSRLRRPVGAGLVAVGAGVVLGNLAGVRELARRRRARRATTTGSAPSRVIPDTINEFPCVLVHCSATCTRTCWRSRSRCWRWRSRCRSRWPARAAPPRGARRRSRRWLRGDRDRDAVRDQLVVVSRSSAGLVALARVVLAARAPSVRERPAHARVDWLVLVLLAELVLVLPFLLNFDPAARRARAACTTARRSRHWAADQALIYGLLRVPRLRRPTLVGAGRARAQPVADGGLDAGGGAVRRLAAGRRPT